MKITSQLFEAYVKCPTKSWLLAQREQYTENRNAEFAGSQGEVYCSKASKVFLSRISANEVMVGPFALGNSKENRSHVAEDVIAQVTLRSNWPGVNLPCDLETHLHLVQSVSSNTGGATDKLMPIRFIIRNKLKTYDRLLMAFDATVLSELTGQVIARGKIVHGEHYISSLVDTLNLASEVRKLVGRLMTLLADQSPPDLVLNRHCPECQFRDRCRSKAREIDDLSLLSGMTEKERSRHRSKGIFTVTQLSYTFRPRRTPKRQKAQGKPHNFALRALAIRENTVFIHGTPELPECQSQVFLDIEGLPDRDFYYLIGALVVTDGQELFHSFWADMESDQARLLAEFTEVVSRLSDFRVFHFGDYDATALKRLIANSAGSCRELFQVILHGRFNILSTLHSHVYFPTYSNSLKDIGRYLGSYPDADRTTGQDSIAWRNEWEATRDPGLKARLIDYNRRDCHALRDLTKFLYRQVAATALDQETGIKVSHTKDLLSERPHWQIFATKQYASEDLRWINKCAYFDYQRDKILVRTHGGFRAINKKSRKRKRTCLRPNETATIEMTRCPKCGGRRIKALKEMNYLLLDLWFSQTGVKKWIRDTHSFRYLCEGCESCFSSEERLPSPRKYGHSLASLVIYLNVTCGLNMGRTTRLLGDVFKIYVDPSSLYRIRTYTQRMYSAIYAELLCVILQQPVIHIDETTVHLSKKRTGYVWVITTNNMVYYFYRPSREGSFLEETLAPFSGILVSDFYAAYESLPCKQQKCLAHLVRDIDDDLLRHPMDIEFKGIATSFGSLLREIIETVDRYGLKKRHLQKHKKKTFRFLESVSSRCLSSELAEKYQKRFKKSGARMFTFLDHDGVPWNNINAEHAIKRFAKHRRDADGRFTEESLSEYLVLASILETCEFNNICSLDFLLSKQTTLEGLLRRTARKRTGLRPALA
jgi:predicted RecB family nuclease